MSSLANIFIKPDGKVFKSLLDLFYPIGTMYLSAENKSPASFLGGTWVQITSGSALRAGIEEYGIIGSDTTTLIVSQIPAHNHSGTAASAGAHIHKEYAQGYNEGVTIPVGAAYITKAGWGYVYSGSSALAGNTTLSIALSNGAHTHTVSTNNTGGGLLTRIFRGLSICLLGGALPKGGDVAWA